MDKCNVIYIKCTISQTNIKRVIASIIYDYYYLFMSRLSNTQQLLRNILHNVTLNNNLMIPQLLRPVGIIHTRTHIYNDDCPCCPSQQLLSA